MQNFKGAEDQKWSLALITNTNNAVNGLLDTYMNTLAHPMTCSPDNCTSIWYVDINCSYIYFYLKLSRLLLGKNEDQWPTWFNLLRPSDAYMRR